MVPLELDFGMQLPQRLARLNRHVTNPIHPLVSTVAGASFWGVSVT
jgi:hypothetical protein